MGDKNNKKLKGRPKFEPNIKQLKCLFKQVSDKTITNEERMENCPLWKDKMVWTKEII